MAKVPSHIAIIMDGNGRWAARHGFPRADGHREGVKRVRDVAGYCLEKGIRYLTLYTFSSENWNRPQDEVQGLMGLFESALLSEVPKLLEHNIRLRAIGDLSRLPASVRQALEHAVEYTKDRDGLDVIFAVSYGSRDEITNAIKLISQKVVLGEVAVEDIDNDTISSHLWTRDIPDPELLIRTSGEYRISNFLLWQIAYSEIVVVPECWPEFSKEVFLDCLDNYSKRQRRFGMTAEQLLEKDGR